MYLLKNFLLELSAPVLLSVKHRKHHVTIFILLVLANLRQIIIIVLYLSCYAAIVMPSAGATMHGASRT